MGTKLSLTYHQSFNDISLKILLILVRMPGFWAYFVDVPPSRIIKSLWTREIFFWVLMMKYFIMTLKYFYSKSKKESVVSRMNFLCNKEILSHITNKYYLTWLVQLQKSSEKVGVETFFGAEGAILEKFCGTLES